jgi:prephenate dehydrogenase
VVAQIEALGIPGLRFVGGHPMTGSAAMGVEHARADLFEGMTYVVTPTQGSDPAAVAQVAHLAAALGSRVLRLDPAAHDQAVAAISHLPHLLATALMMVTDDRAQAGEPVYELTAGSWASGTRVAASGAALWREIFASNRDAVLRAVADFEAALGGLRETLAAGDDESLEALLETARRAKLAHPGR